MQDSDKILSRLIGILKKLSNQEKPKVKELATFFSVTERTIQRDLYQRLSHFPIEKNAQSQLQFVNGFSLEQSVLDNDEMLFTYFALCKMKEDNPHFEEKIHKILKKLVKPQTKIDHLTPTTHQQDTQQILEKIEDAILKNNVLKIDCTQKPITIKPYKLYQNNAIHTLVGEDCDDKKIKSIQVSQILDVHIQKQRFKTKKLLTESLGNVHTALFLEHHSKEYEALITKEMAHYFTNKKLLPSQEVIASHEDGSIEIRFIAENEHQVENIVKHWMPHLKITKPVAYNEQLISKMRHYINACTN